MNKKDYPLCYTCRHAHDCMCYDEAKEDGRKGIYECKDYKIAAKLN